MKIFNLVISLVGLPALCLGQLLWLESGPEGVVDHINSKSVGGEVLAETLNHHSLFSLDLDLQEVSLSGDGLTVFSVYDGQESGVEQVLWTVAKEQKDLLICTNQRSANLLDGTFMNYPTIHPEKAQMSTFYTNQPFGVGAGLSLGKEPHLASIPVESFGGRWAEIIVFEKALSPISIRIIESILSLKYSLNLPAAQDYLGVQGERLWERTDGDYQTRIGGIGRFDGLHFNQRISTTALNQGFVTVASEDSIYVDNSYLLWADDDKGMTFSTTNGVQTLERSWRLQKIRMPAIEVSIAIDHGALVEQLPKDYSYYAGLTTDGVTDFVKLDVEGKSITGRLPISADDAVLRVTQAPDFWTYVETRDGRCDASMAGHLHGQVIGGVGPYLLTVTDDDGIATQYTIETDSYDLTLEMSGRHIIEVVDSDGQSWSSAFYINTSDLPQPNLDKVYLLDQDQPTIKPYDEVPDGIDIEWRGQDGSIDYGTSFTPSVAGHYHLIVRSGDCSSWHPFEVIESPKPILNSRVYPNPATSYRQYLTATLAAAMPYDISVATSTGQVLINQHYPAAQLIYQPFALDQGVYVVSLRVGRQVVSHPLIVIR